MLMRLFIVAACTVVSVTSAAFGLEYDQNIYLFHEGKNDPTTESNLWTLDVGSNPAVVSSGPGTEIIGPNSYDFWHTTDAGTAANQYLNYKEPISATQALSPWTLRARFRSVNTTTTDQSLLLFDGTNRWGVWLRDDRLLNANSTQTLLTMADLTSDYRELELLYKPLVDGIASAGDMLEIYLDQTLVTSILRGSTLASTTSPSIWFGGNSSANTGRVNWNRIEFVEGATLGFAQVVVPIPEPGTLGLMLFGSVGLMMYRRGRHARGERSNGAK